MTEARYRTVAEYARHIATLRSMIAASESAALGPVDFATVMGNASLRQRIATLEQEMASLTDDQMPGQELELVFDGGPVRLHRVKAEFIGEVLIKVQQLVRSMVASRRQGSAAGARGPFPADILRMSELELADVFPGSFGVRLESTDDQLELEGAASIAPTLQRLVELLEAGDDPATVVSRLSDLGSDRAVQDYTDLVAELSENEANMRVIWPSLTGTREVAMKSTEATRLLGTLREMSEDTTAQWYEGVLDISNSRHGRFGFEAVTGEVFDGQVEEHLIPKLREFYDRKCRAWIQTRVVHHRRTGVEKRTHRLQQLERLSKK